MSFCCPTSVCRVALNMSNYLQTDLDEMVPIPVSFQLSPRQTPRRHSFEPSILMPIVGNNQKTQFLQHLEVTYFPPFI